MDIIKIVDSFSPEWSIDIKTIFKDLVIIHREEIKRKNIFSETFRESRFILDSYSKRYDEIIEKGTPDLNHYLSEIQSTEFKRSFKLELMDAPLSTFFKVYLVFTKSILDKLIAIFKFRYKNYDKKTFEKRGNHLLKYIKTQYSDSNKDKIIELIEISKKEWMDDLLMLRDEFTHFSNLLEYKNFHIQLKNDNSKVKGIEDFKVPEIRIKGKYYTALEYLEYIHSNIISFSHNFLVLCGFTEYYNIPTKYKCDKCNFEFIQKTTDGKELNSFKNDLTVRIINKKFNHGEVTCPECRNVMEMNINGYMEISKKLIR